MGKIPQLKVFSPVDLGITANVGYLSVWEVRCLAIDLALISGRSPTISQVLSPIKAWTKVRLFHVYTAINMRKTT
jgi:hypothetical protein